MITLLEKNHLRESSNNYYYFCKWHSESPRSPVLILLTKILLGTEGGNYPEGGSLGDGNDPQWPPANKKSICLNLPSFCFPVYGKFRPILM